MISIIIIVIIIIIITNIIIVKVAEVEVSIKGPPSRWLASLALFCQSCCFDSRGTVNSRGRRSDRFSTQRGGVSRSFP